ncbi:FG-GAP-like repeat-containing protein [Silvibacterium sp.]|uniref:FG-GAP-like repeat-containing protein n=1 Tax=Silvibacterium sp. TaxID=1964179 RepID=UPI0039E6AD11
MTIVVPGPYSGGTDVEGLAGVQAENESGPYEDCRRFAAGPTMDDWMRIPGLSAFSTSATNLSRPLLTLACCAALGAIGCHSGKYVPAPGSESYSRAISDFYVGLSALQVGDDVRAESALSDAAAVAPGEPAMWVNWGILALRQRNFDVAAERLNRAAKLAPHNAQVYYLLGVLESERGNMQAAVSDFGLAAGFDPQNARVNYALGEAVERQGSAGSDQMNARILMQIRQVYPHNVVAELDLARVAAKSGNASLLRPMVQDLEKQAAGWPADAQAQLKLLAAAAAAPDVRPAARRTLFLRNVLMQVPAVRQDLALLKPAPGDEAQPLTRPLKMAAPSAEPAPADTAMQWKAEPLGSDTVAWAGAISLTGEGAPVTATANAQFVTLSSGAQMAFPGGASGVLTPESVLPVDFNYDFKTDLVLAGQGGVRFFRQDSPAQFTDVTPATKLPEPVLHAAYTGAWAADIEADGDLDIVLGTAAGPVTVLRNNGDGTFAVLHPFAGVHGLAQFVWADLNSDGLPDAALIDAAGKLHMFINQRLGAFAETPVPVSEAKAVTVADVGGSLSLVVATPDGKLVRLAASQDDAGSTGAQWTTATLADGAATQGPVRLYASDLDNNGAVDLVLSPVGGDAAGVRVWLGDEHGNFLPAPQPQGLAKAFGIADLKADGQMALLGLTADGHAAALTVQGTKRYHWQTVRPKARTATGDQRINSFGIGGDIEIRSGLLTQRQVIAGPQLHFGLGTHTQSEVARIIWPNGSVRAEFALKADQQVLTEQRLKGSCPFLFAWDGKEMKFVEDTVPWGSALGLRIDGVGTAAIAATEEWYKIRGDQLAARDGNYDLRITGELWETYYYDHLKLLAVDHPAGTEIFTGEMFVVPAVKPAVTATAEPEPIAQATDDLGHDVTATLRARDGQYLDTFGRGQYQGVTRDHYVELDLGKDAPDAGPLYLIASGWLHPLDSSVNVAMEQGAHPAPKALSLEVVDRDGHWHVAKANLGFPAGRKKTCLIDLTGVFLPGAPHKVRLRTNLEIYWDQIEWAKGAPEAQVRVTPLTATSADLHYRGYSTIDKPNDSSPEVPEYDRLMATTQIWRDLSGYYTRYGDVRELLAKTDDRYVIMNAGDEMSLRFAAPAAPPAGWVRDFIIAGDGWVKDGDYNSTFSSTVQPLPYHERTVYDAAPGRLEDEWVYKHHPEDWQTYQTRWVSPERFVNALRSSEAR